MYKMTICTSKYVSNVACEQAKLHAHQLMRLPYIFIFVRDRFLIRQFQCKNLISFNFSLY